MSATGWVRPYFLRKGGGTMKTKLCATILALSFFFFFSPILLSPSAAETEVSEKIGIFWEGTTFDKKTGTTFYTLSLRNNSRETLSGPFRVVVEQIDNSYVSIVNPDGVTSDGKPYFIYNKDSLAPWGKTASKVWKFRHQCKRLSIVLFKEIRFFQKISQWECSWFATCYTSIFSGTVTNQPPVADAGSDRDVMVGDLVTLDGRNSYDPDEDLITYNWSITGAPAGSTTALDNPASVVPTFIPDKPGIYTFSLVVSDGKASSAPDFVQITAALPNVAPTANAGPDQTVITGSIVYLDGSWSFDPDGDPLTYYWQILSKPEGSNAFLSDPNSVSPNFLADQDGDYFIQLTVGDGDLYSLPDDVIIVSATPNAPPVAYAGDDQIVSKNTTIQLDGRGSSDPNNDPLTYIWSIVSKPAGSTSELDDPSSSTPQILADKVGDYVFTLIVYDGELYSAPDTVVIKVVNDPPIADAGPDQDGVVGVPITLNGGGSSDPNGDTLTYQWSIVSAPTGSSAAIVNPTSMTPTITPDRPGIYAIQLVVNDGSTDSAPDTINLTVRVTVPNVVGQPQASAEAAIVAAGLTVGAISQANSAVVPAGNVISQNPVGGTLALAGSPVSLTISLGPAPVLVPNVVGMTQPAAEAAILAAGLQVGTVTTANSPTVPAGSVISQNPSAGSSVPEGSSVSLVVSLGPIMVTVPNVVGMTLANAEATITSANLTGGTITTANSDTVPASSVISQTPIAGISVAIGSSVDLVISIGPLMAVTVPNVVGQPEASAEAAIIAAGLTLGAITQAKSTTVPAGSVISQVPVSGTSVAEGSPVYLVVSLGPASVVVPNVVGIAQAEAQTAIAFASLTLGTITTANSLEVPRGNVISQAPSAGSSVSEGSSVSLVVSLGPPLTTVPDVLGFTQEAAQSAIVAAGLNVGAVTSYYHDSIPAGSVISQNPAGGSSRAQGSTVNLLISLGPPGPPPPENGVLLEGPPDAPAMSALQRVNLISGVPANEISIDSYGREVARTELLLKLASNVTVGAVNSALMAVGARITWMTTDVPYLLVRVPDPGTPAGLDALVSELLATSAFDQVLRAYFSEPAALPESFNPVTLNQFDVIDHLLGINAPAAWNARASLQDKELPTFLIADFFGDGPPQVPPFAVQAFVGDFSTGTYSDGHGYHVLGIAAADFGGEVPTGLFPSLSGAPLPVSAVDLTLPALHTPSGRVSNPALYGALIDRLEFLTSVGKRVVLNTSLHIPCPFGPCPAQDFQLEAMTWITAVRAKNLEDKFLHITIAGNIEGADNDDAHTGSPFTAAALLPLPWPEPNLTNTIVVENVVGRATPPYYPQCLNSSSKVGGHVSAIGTDVDSYDVPSLHDVNMTGTSMAAPQVAALAAYVWALNPNLTPVQLKETLLSTARKVTPPNVRPAKCKASTPAPHINAYGAVLATDEPVALSAAGKPVDDAPARSAILDVADSNGVEGGDKKFDQGDLTVFLDKITQGVGPAQTHQSGYDWSRYDLSGDGHTGVDRGNGFNLDMNQPISLSYVSAPEDANMTFNERCVSDMQILCYYAYSPMYSSDGNSRSERDDLLKRFCGHSQKTWLQEPTQMPSDARLAVDGRGTVFAAFVGAQGITVGQVVPGGVLVSASWPGSAVYGFAVDKRGNMVVAYRDGDYLFVRRYNADGVWYEAVQIDVDTEYFRSPVSMAIATAGDSRDAMFVWVTWWFHPGQGGGDRRAYLVKAIRYDAVLGWQTPPIVLASEDTEQTICSPSSPCGWCDFLPLVRLAMNGRGDAVVAWAGFDALNKQRVLRASRYQAGGDWSSAATLITDQGLLPNHGESVAIDWQGNAFVTSLHLTQGTQVTRYDVDTGDWELPQFVGHNWPTDYFFFGDSAQKWVGSLRQLDEGYYQPVSLIAVDACGNAILVFEQFFDGYSSLVSRRFYIDTGWEDSLATIDPIFTVGAPGSVSANSKAILSLSMHGGGNATLIAGEGTFNASKLSLLSWQYHPERGWADAVGDIKPDTVYSDPICRRPIIDGFGNGVAITFVPRPGSSVDYGCGIFPGVEVPHASAVLRYE
jgi:beta-lactam-binding protein with PASTA domain